MENLYYCKKVKNIKNDEMLTKLYSANLWNLKIVLSMASGTKEKLMRMNNIMLNTEKGSSTIIRPVRKGKSFGGNQTMVRRTSIRQFKNN